MSTRVLLSCGEPSGDLYAGALVRALHALAPEVEVFGRAGSAFAEAGGELLDSYRGSSVTGFAGILTAVPRLWRAKAQLVRVARERQASVLVAIDYDGFNARLARDIKALGIPVVYYISPQVWAWRTGRIKRIRRLVDRMLVIFPFELEFYRKAGVPVDFVGHPLLDVMPAPPTRHAFLTSVGLAPDQPTVGLLPGSRRSELRLILPTLVDAARRMRAQRPEVQFVVARAPGLDDELFVPLRGLAGTALVEGQTDAVLSAVDVAITASGTATVQTAIHRTPMVVVYRVSALEYRLARRFVKLDTFAMVNLLAGRRIVPELIQDAFTPAAVAHEAIDLLGNPQRSADMRAALAEVTAGLGAPGASRRAASAILEVARS